MRDFLLIVFSYLVGSISFAYIASRIFKNIDIRTVGDRNAGVANVFRHIGITAGIFTAVADIGKGTIAIFTAQLFCANNITVLLCGIASILGHAWPIFFGFKGGRGVATTTGVFLALMPLPTFLSLMVLTLIILKTGNMTFAVTALFVSILTFAALIEKSLMFFLYFLLLGFLLKVIDVVIDKNLSVGELEESNHLRIHRHQKV